jgi:alkylation response protein AidB-like acyl-CoA dehydrogenase
MSERSELQVVLRDFLARTRSEGAPETGLDRAWWGRFAGLGVFGLAVPETQGGLGIGLREAADAFEAIGAALAPGPVVWTQLAAFTLESALDGTCVVAGVDRTATAPDDPVLVPHLADADMLLVLTEQGAVLHERAELTATDLGTALDPGTPVSRLDAVRGGRIVTDVAGCERLRRLGTLLTAAVLVGVSDGALAAATEYALVRHQFGRPIGSFQALKHLLADAYTRTQLTRAAVCAAAELDDAESRGATARADGGLADVATAKLLAGRAADANARTAVQVFGGMGFAAETSPHRYLKRAWVLEHEFGTMREHAMTMSGVVAHGSIDERSEVRA